MTWIELTEGRHIGRHYYDPDTDRYMLVISGDDGPLATDLPHLRGLLLPFNGVTIGADPLCPVCQRLVEQADQVVRKYSTLE